MTEPTKHIGYEPVQAVRLTMHCECGHGHYKYTGQSTLIPPITHSHRCTSCTRRAQLAQKFPAVEHFNAMEMEILAKDF